MVPTNSSKILLEVRSIKSITKTYLNFEKKLLYKVRSISFDIIKYLPTNKFIKIITWFLNHIFFLHLLVEKLYNNHVVSKIKTEAFTQKCSWEKVFWKYAANLQEKPMSKCDFNKLAKQLYWNHTSAWEFSRKSAAYFQNTFY